MGGTVDELILVRQLAFLEYQQEQLHTHQNDIFLVLFHEYNQRGLPS